jgi:hypothetical protein
VALQSSVPSHAFPFEQLVPAATGVWLTPVTGSHSSAVHGFSSSVDAGEPATHAPDWHESATVHASSSEHAEPFGFAGFEQTPVAGLHVPASWHWSSAVQTTGVPSVQTPEALQVSAPSQASESAQLVPVATGVWVTPATASQASVVHGFPSSVDGGVPGVQVPAWQVSEPLHTVVSLHAVPFGFSGFEHAPFAGLQVPTSWHVSDATQTTGLAPLQEPD